MNIKKQDGIIIFFVICIAVIGLSVASIFGANGNGVGKERKKLKQFSIKENAVVMLKFIRSNDTGTATETLTVTDNDAVLERAGTKQSFTPRGISIDEARFKTCVKRALKGSYATRERAKKMLQGIVLVRSDGAEEYAEFPKKLDGPMKQLYQDLMAMRTSILETGQGKQEP